MRFAVKSTVSLIALYAVILGGLIVWADYEQRSVATSLMEDTARLVGNEIAAAMSESAREQLLLGDPATRQRLVQVVADLTQRSDVVASIAVVDETGKVIVSDELETGQQLALPAVIFQETTQPQFLSSPSPLQGGTYHLLVPLLRQDAVVGYIRLSLSSQRIAALYRRARHRLALAALIGLTGVIGLGVLLQVRLSRRGAALVRTLEATARGEVVPSHAQRDEFSQVMEAAGKLGRELSATRERGSQAERRVSALANFMDVGVLLLGPDQHLEFANAAARELLGCTDPGDLEQRWDGMRQLLVDPLDGAGARQTGKRVDVEIPLNGSSRSLRLELHRPEDDEHGGYLVLVKDREQLEAFETDLRLATQMRGLARVYGALAHELKAPLGAMALNLELLNDALNTDAETDDNLRDKRRRYAAVLREELARLNRSLVSVLDQATSMSEVHERFDLRTLVRDIDTLLAPQAKLQRVALEVQLPEREVPLAGHRDRLKQALLNIATNALEAMPDGGRMGVTLDAQDGHATVIIRDSGDGIPPETLEKIYGMYFTTKRGGTGIGLYVSRSVVES
ncbi:MAG TPA: ATP-binding protein, partial [Candidatus Acidoferrales bacterium]|nr:ATP-binding protein [Candidatus Acidoferrales bacterium]